MILFNVRRNLLKTMFLETRVHCTLKTFLSLLKKGCLYSFLIAAFFENIGTPSSFEDDETSTIFKQETFLNCLVCLSLRVYWSQILRSVLLLSSLLFLAKQKQAYDLLSYLKSKALPEIFSFRKKPVTGSFDTMMVTTVV